MTAFLIILFALTLIYLGITERFRNYVKLIAFQGFILFVIAIFELEKINILNLLFIVVETLVFKAIVVPMLMNRIIEKNHIYKVHSRALPSFYNLILIILSLIVSVLIVSTIHNYSVDHLYFSVALFCLFSGIIIIVTHRKLFSHLTGFLVIENAVFLMTLALGNESPMLINTGILLDIVVSVLIFGVFINKIGSSMHDLESDNLTRLKN